MPNRVARATLVLPVAAVTFLAAGCGGSHSPGVANIGAAATTTTTTTTGSSAASGPSGGGPGGGAAFALRTAGGAKFSACMRTHGVPNFPDPNNQGVIGVTAGSGIDPGSPTFRAAAQHCSSLLPNGGRPSPQQQAKMRAALLAFSACMRKHGVTNFPDPTFSDGGAHIHISGGSGTNLDPQSPVFHAAQTACSSKLPGRVGAFKANAR